MRAFHRLLLTILILSLLLVGCQQAEDKKEEGKEGKEQSGQDKDASKEAEDKEGTQNQEAKEENKEEKAAAEPAVWRVGGLKGPTAIGMAELISKHEEAKDIDFTIYGAIDELSAKVLKGEVDIATIPANLASVLYNKSKGAIQVAAINTLGVTTIVDKGGEILSLADLKGKTIAATGKGAVPEATLRLMLEQVGLNPDEDITIEWKSEPSELMGWLGVEGNNIAMIPQPFATVATKKIEGLRIVLDLSDEWSNLKLPGDFITGVLVVRKDIAEKEADRLRAFLKEYAASIEFARVSEEAPALIAKYDIIDEKVAKMALPSLNMVYMDGEEMKASMKAYLELLHKQKAEFVGGTLPDEAFYFLP